MPTVVVMDVSLSMTRPVSVEGSEEYQRKHLAVHGLTMLFEHMATNYKLEFTALVVFSSLWELMVPFTRDYNTLQVHLIKNILGSASQFFKTLCVFHGCSETLGFLAEDLISLYILLIKPHNPMK
uniref:Integrator complex subunit 14 n=1 Tax=Terrapene triunguis TaxID=2587831 RepID=A0A674IDR7_9SAUR